MILDNLEPKNVFTIFEKLSTIPHGSYNVDAVSDWIVSFAKEHKLKYVQDSYKNVVVTKEADKGYENVPTIILQGHTDMVCSKEPGFEFDFLNDPLQLYIDGDFLKAKGTTLGADDGVAIAYALAILTEKDFKTGKIEAVFTVNEEVGLLGAASISPEIITGRHMINIDSCEESSIIVSCAGGQDAEIQFAYCKEPCTEKLYRLEVSGLNGGHSGEQINQGLANANKILINVVSKLLKKINIKVAELNGGVADNVIPSNAYGLLCVNNEDYETALDIISKLEDLYKEIYSNTDKNISITLLESDVKINYVINDDALTNILNFVNEAPNGVVKMSEHIEGLVETSLNLGIINTEDDYVSLIYSMRSSVDNEKKALFNKITDIAVKHSGVVEDLGGYPGWELKKESELRPIFEKVFYNKNGKQLKVEAIHAGLECGIFAGKIENLDCVSMGPDVFDLHTTSERLSISSAKRTYELLKNVITCFSEEMSS